MKVRGERFSERMLMWIAWHLPKRLVVWCYYRVHGFATGGRYSTLHPDEVNWRMAITAFEEDAH